jgi:hypothetical protein
MFLISTGLAVFVPTRLDLINFELGVNYPTAKAIGLFLAS